MSLNYNPTLFAQDFRASLELGLQQMGSKLRPFVTTSTTSGAKQKVAVEREEAIEASIVTGQIQPVVPVNAAVTRRWVQPVSYDVTQLVDHFDQLKMLNDPSSVKVQNAIHAIGREMDDEIISAFFAASTTGETGGTSSNFDTANFQIAVNFEAAANTGLTVAKLRGAMRKLRAAQNDLDRDPVYCVINAKMMDDLLKEAQIIGREYNDAMVLKEGRIDSYLGINFVYCERLQTSTNLLCPVFVKSAIHLCVWEDIVTNVSQRFDLRGMPYQTYCQATFGATRTHESKIVQVLVAT
jgi:hypothetical protein